MKKLILGLATVCLSATVAVASPKDVVKLYWTGQTDVSVWGLYGSDETEVVGLRPKSLPVAAAATKLATAFARGESPKSAVIKMLTSLSAASVTSLLLCTADVLEHVITEDGNRFTRGKVAQPARLKKALPKLIRALAWTVYVCAQNGISPKSIIESVKHPRDFLKTKWSKDQMLAGAVNTFAPLAELAYFGHARPDVNAIDIEKDLDKAFKKTSFATI